jgi:hypothetical protein
MVPVCWEPSHNCFRLATKKVTITLLDVIHGLPQTTRLLLMPTGGGGGEGFLQFHEIVIVHRDIFASQNLVVIPIFQYLIY